MACRPTINQKRSIEIQQDNDAEILWHSNRKLSWNDFIGVPKEEDKGSKIAITQCQIRIIDSYWDNNLPKYRIGTYFIKSKSWTIVKDSITLSHEQLHFDIYELYTRRIREEFEKLNLKKVTDFKSYNEIYTKLVNKAIEINRQYDNEVYFNDLKQQEWITKIANQLEELKEYE
ncbi:hypothetical protein A9Q86_15350 [Flavobacteriales bacterium 33_180_T64]|mgnify:CR=1 FL=1|nr:hypothetical protein A9Q86_15350 [Flavobacteriales bacterium 33_180_T64]